MATVEDLSVRVSASTSSFTSSMRASSRRLSDLRDEALETASGLQILQGRMDETGDEARSLFTRIGILSGGMSALGTSAGSASLGLMALSLASTLSLIPAILTLTTVVIPLTAALGGFLAIALAITGVGLVGFIGGVMTNTERLGETFSRLTTVLGEEFGPAFDIFAGVVDDLMNHFIDIIPELVPAEHVLIRISQQFEYLGEAIIDALPAFVDFAVQMADEFLPPFVDFVENILPKVVPWMRGLIDRMFEAGNALGPLIAAFDDIRPALMEFGMTILNVIIPPLARIFNLLQEGMRWFNELDTSMQMLVGRALIMAPAILKLLGVLGGLSAPFLAAAAAVGLFVHAWVNGWDETKVLINDAVDVLLGTIGYIEDWVIENGPRIINKAIGLFQDIARDAAAWLVENGPPLVGEAFEAIGEAIRFVALDVYNAVTGNDDSILRTIVTDIATWLIENGPTVLGEAIDTAISVIVEAVKGLWRGLIGDDDAEFPTIFNDIKKYIVGGGKDLLVGGFETVVGAVTGAFNYVIGTGPDTLYGDIKSAFGEIEDLIDDLAEGVTGVFADTWNGTVGGRSLNLPEATIGIPDWVPKIGGRSYTIGGQGLSIPELQTGGFIEDEGLAMLHSGEQVVPAAQVDRRETGEGGDTINIEVDARGSDDPHRTRKNAERGLSNALDAYNVGR